jgi:hypothetical protein
MIYKTLLCSYSNTNQICCQCLINEADNFHSFCTYYFIILNTCKNVYTQFAYKYDQSIKQFIDLNLISNETNRTANYTNYTAVNINNISYFILNDLLFSFNDVKNVRITEATTQIPPTAATSTSLPIEQQQQQPKAQQKAQQPIQIQPIITNTNTKDAMFMRLSNRIRSLELNMSLSGQYLEQLSQHYRKQIDEMQRIFNKTTNSLNNTTVVIDEYNLKQQSQIKAIENRLDRLDYMLTMFINYFSTNFTLSRSPQPRVNKPPNPEVNQDGRPVSSNSGNNVYFINNEVFLLLVLILVLNICLFVVLFVYVRVRMRTCYSLANKCSDQLLVESLVNKYLSERFDRIEDVKPIDYEEIGAQVKTDGGASKCGGGAAVVVMAAVAAAAAASPSPLAQMNTNT